MSCMGIGRSRALLAACTRLDAGYSRSLSANLRRHGDVITHRDQPYTVRIRPESHPRRALRVRRGPQSRLRPEPHPVHRQQTHHPLVIGARRTITRRVTEVDLATSLYPDFVKPPVLATARLVEWCERAAMEEIGECSLGTKLHVSHIAPTVLGGLVTITAVCAGMSDSYSEWRVAARDEHEVIALGTLGFVVVDMERYLSRRLGPKQLAERSHGRGSPADRRNPPSLTPVRCAGSRVPIAP